MDPFTLLMGATSLAGLGMKIFGGDKQGSDSSAYASQSNAAMQAYGAKATGLNNQIADQEQSANDVRQQAMEVSARRQSLEIMRNSQRMGALALSNAVNSGSQFGSGLAGGEAQVQDQSAFNLQGVNQNLMAGRQMFGIDNTISGLKRNVANNQLTYQMQKGSLDAQYQTQSANNQGMQAFGGGLMQAASPMGAMAKNFMGGNAGGPNPLGSMGSFLSMGSGFGF